MARDNELLQAYYEAFEADVFNYCKKLDPSLKSEGDTCATESTNEFLYVQDIHRYLKSIIENTSLLLPSLEVTYSKEDTDHFFSGSFGGYESYVGIYISSFMGKIKYDL